MSSRLFQEVREQRGLSLFRFFLSFFISKTVGLLTIYGGTGAKQLDLLFETIQETLER